MIAALAVYNDIKNLILKDGRTGYFSFADFNALAPEVETMLLSYYCDVLEDSSERMERLAPFVKEAPLEVTLGYVPFPSNYRKHIAADYTYATNLEGSTEPTIKTFPLDYLAAAEWKDTIVSAIRKPRVSKEVGYYRIINNKFQVSFTNGTFNLVYVEKPTAANIVFTYDSVEQDYVYTSETPFSWLIQDRPNIIDLFCVHLGIAHRENFLTQWAAMNKKMVVK